MAAVLAPAASSGSFLITPNVGLMVWTLLLFGISMFALYKWAFPYISQALDRRQRAIEESIDHAERTREQADALLAEYRERLQEARQQGDEIIAQGSTKGIALGVGAGLGTIGPGIGVGYIFGKVIESVTRQPEMRDEITSIQWLGFALTEACFFYGLVAGLLSYVLK